MPSMAQYNVDSLLWQGFFAITMFFSTFISYLFPIIIFNNRYRKNTVNEEDIQQPHHWSNNQILQSTKQNWKKWLSYCNCISAGVFLGVCFLNLVPCVEDEFAALIKDFPSLKNFSGTFPLGQFSVICGFFLVLFLENFLSGCFQNTKNTNDLTVPILYLDEELHLEHSDDHLEQEELLPNTIGNNLIPSNQNTHSFNNEHNNHQAHHHHHEHEHDHGHHHHHHHFDLAKENNSMFSFFILMFATSIHSLFEGLALGLQSNLKTAIHLFIGIILHECLVALAIGLNAIRLQQENINMKTHIKFAIVFSMNIPFGNVLGVLLGYTPGHIGRFISAIFQGFAAGTFIHVTFFELIPEEFILNTSDKTNKSLDNHQIQIETNAHDEPNQSYNHTHNLSLVNNDNLETAISNNASVTITNTQRINCDNKHFLNLKLRKISLLFLGFFIMSLVSFIFSD